jgi:Fe-S cluster assembly iron-binding protein IscA
MRVAMLEITESAADVLHRAYDAAARFNPEAKIRVFTSGERIDTGFADEPEPTDEVIEFDGISLYVESGIQGTLDTTEQHDRLIVR